MSKKKPFLVCFIGIDGSGKTTQAKALVRALEEHGIRSKYVWNRFEPRLTKPFMLAGKALFFRGKGMLQNYAEYSNTKKRLFQNPIIAILYQYLVLLDYLAQAVIHVRLPLLRGKNLVCDRYAHDTVADLAVDFGYSIKTTSRLNRLLYLLPKPDIVFLIDVHEEIAYQRKDDVPSIEHLKERREIYLAMRKGVIMLDGSKGDAELESLVLDKVKGVIG